MRKAYSRHSNSDFIRFTSSIPLHVHVSHKLCIAVTSDFRTRQVLTSCRRLS